MIEKAMKKMSFSDSLYALAAKSSRVDRSLWLPLWMHGVDTAEVMRRLLNRWVPDVTKSAIGHGMSEEDLERLVVFLGMVHDIGKATAVFQTRIAASIEGQRERLSDAGLEIPAKVDDYSDPGKTPHSVAGEEILRELGCQPGIASIVGAHHGKPGEQIGEPGIFMLSYNGNFYFHRREAWCAVWEEWCSFSLKYAGYASKSDLPDIDVPTQVLLTGMLITADWIASNSRWFPLVPTEERCNTGNYSERVNRGWKAFGPPDKWEPVHGEIEECFEDRFGFLPNEVQRELIHILEDAIQPGLIIIEAPMGNGKTEAALAAAEFLAETGQVGGVYFGLPTQATANGLFPRVKKWAEQQSLDEKHTIELLHGAAALNPLYRTLLENAESMGEDLDSDGIEVHRFFDSKKTGLLSDFAVGTVDQLLMAALKQKHVMLKLFGLVGKAVIVDECHAYDAYMNTYLDRVLNWLGRYGTPVILLSATLPSRRRDELLKAYLRGRGRLHWKEGSNADNAYPLITWTDGLEVHSQPVNVGQREKVVHIEHIGKEKMPVCLAERCRNGGCAGIIVNTVRHAQEIARQLRAQLAGYDVILYHAQFTMADRAELEKAILKRVGKYSTRAERDHLIVVGTQVLEQSLDLDFDILFTELCPMDLLLQRIGRLHRHGVHDDERPQELATPCCVIVDSEDKMVYDDGSRHVYGDWLLRRTLKLLPDQVCLPADIPILVNQVYAQPDTELLSEQERQSWEELETRRAEQRGRAKGYCISAPKRGETMAGLLDHDVESDAGGDAAVRDTGSSIEVILVQEDAEQKIHFLPWVCDGMEIAIDRPPDNETSRILLEQKLRLPRWLLYNPLVTIRALEEGAKPLSEWYEAPLLRRELFLILDQYFEAELAEHQVCYDRELGFLAVKRGQGNGQSV